jgi:hypothetical protein
MEIVRSIRSLLRRLCRRRRLRPIALEFSILGKLPLELLLCIADFLPPESALAFSLCCVPLYLTVRVQPLEQDDLYKFLTLLKRQLPHHILCICCKKLLSNSSYYSSQHDIRCQGAGPHFIFFPWEFPISSSRWL